MPEPVEFGVPHRGPAEVSRAAAYVVLRDPEGRILVVRSEHGLFLPGGGSDRGESAESTVVRECLEEIGCEIEIERHIGAAVQHFTASDGTRYRGSFDFFLGTVVREGVGPSEHEAVWLAPSELERGLYHESHEWALRLAVSCMC